MRSHMNNEQNKEYSFPVTMIGKILSYSGIEHLTHKDAYELIKHSGSELGKNLRAKYDESFSSSGVKQLKYTPSKTKSVGWKGLTVLLPTVKLQIEDCFVDCDSLLTLGCGEYESNAWITLSYSSDMRKFDKSQAQKFYDATGKLGLKLSDIILDEYVTLVNNHTKETGSEPPYTSDVAKVIEIRSAETTDNKIKELISHKSWDEDDFNIKEQVVNDSELFKSLKDLVYWGLGKNFNTYEDFESETYDFMWVKLNGCSKSGVFLNSRQQEDDGTIRMTYTGLGLGSNHKHSYRKSASYSVLNDLWFSIGSKDFYQDN